MKNELISRRGVCSDINLSPFKLSFEYTSFDNNFYTLTSEVVFVFSSEFYMNNFRSKYDENRKNINNSLSNRFGFEIVNNLLCDLKLYASIEKRGFLVYRDGEKIECLSNIILDGETLTLKN